MGIYNRIKTVLHISSNRADSSVIQDAEAPTTKFLPKMEEVATYTVWDRRQPTLKDISLDTINAAVTQADKGQIKALMELAELVEERDCHISAVIQSRKLAVSGRNWSVLAASDGNDQVAEACDKMLRGLPDFESALLDLLDAILKGVSIQEIIWGTGPTGKPIPVDLVWRHQKKFVYNTQSDEYPIDQLRLLTIESPFYGIELPKDHFILHCPRLRSGWKSRAGLVRMLAILYAIKFWALADWSSFAEVFASPLKIGQYEPGTPAGEINNLRDGLESLGSAGAAIISKLTTIDFKSAAGTGGDRVYLELCRYLDAQASKAVLGHVASTDAVSGSLGGAETSAVSAQQIILQADAKALESTIRRDLFSPFVRENFQEGTEVPYLHIDVAEGEDLSKRADVDVKLVNMGWQVPVSYIVDVYGRPVAVNGEEVLVAPSTQATTTTTAVPSAVPSAVPAVGAPLVEAPVTDTTVVAKDPTTALNGAQVSSLLEIIGQVVSGLLPRETAVLLISSAFPISAEMADKILGTVGKTFSPAAPEEVPPFDGGRATRNRGVVALPVKQARQYAEELIKQTMKEANPIWRKYLAPAVSAIQDATSYEDLVRRLTDIGLDSSKVQDLIHRCKLTSQMVGRLAVQGDVGMSLGEMPATLTPVKPTEAMEALGKRMVISKEEFKAADDATKAASFTVAGEQDLEVINSIKGKIQTALDNGTTLETFKKDLGDLSGTDLGDAHAETVFRTNIMSSVSAGRWKQQTSPGVTTLRPYLQYRAVGDSRTRSSHKAWDKLVYPADHDFWKTHYPPNGMNCRCTVVSLSQRQVDAAGLKVEEVSSSIPPDEGFGANPGMVE